MYAPNRRAPAASSGARATNRHTVRSLGLGVVAALCATSLTYAQDPGPANEQEARDWPAARSIVLPGADQPDVRPPARVADPQFPGLNAILDSAIGLEDNGVELRGMAPRYEAVFDSDGIRFYPSLGILTERDYSIEFTLESIGRDGGAMQRVEAGERTFADHTVTYSRGTFDEIYEIRKDAMAQSFLFRSLPAGTGDLVVRYRVATELEASLHGHSDDGMEFRLPGAGAATIGGVTGIDANGAESPGSMRYADGVWELVLPAAFVNQAALPLILDPLIGSTLTVATQAATFDQRDPDVSFDVASNSYLAVWEREVGSTFQIRGARLDTAGAPIGGLIGINTTATSKFDPRCARAFADVIAVVWSESSDIRGTAVVASTGTVIDTAGITVAGGTDLQVAPDIGGEATNVDNDAIVVWWNLTTNEIEARQLQVIGTTTVNLAGPIINITTLSGGGGTGDSLPAISKSGGSTGNHLIVYQRGFTADSEIRGMIVDRNINVIDGFISITSNALDDLDPACDGDGLNWVVAYERDEAVGSADQDIFCRGVYLNGAGTVGLLNAAEISVEAGAGDDEQNPTVSWTGGSALIGFSDEVASPNYDAYVRSVDPFTCTDCEGEATLELGARDSDFIAIASEFSGGGSGATAMIVWDSEDTTTFDSEILGRVYRNDTGLVTDEGGGCGTGGEALAHCARDGNSSFEHRLRGAAPSATAVLVFSLDRIDGACGTCTLVPNPFSGFGLGTTTDTSGNAAVAMAIPASTALEGLVFYDQWLVASAAPACTFVNVDLSNAISVQIQ